jgi:hypothetical protein
MASLLPDTQAVLPEAAAAEHSEEQNSEPSAAEHSEEQQASGEQQASEPEEAAGDSAGEEASEEQPSGEEGSEEGSEEELDIEEERRRFNKMMASYKPLYVADPPPKLGRALCRFLRKEVKRTGMPLDSKTMQRMRARSPRFGDVLWVMRKFDMSATKRDYVSDLGLGISGPCIRWDLGYLGPCICLWDLGYLGLVSLGSLGYLGLVP